MITATYTKRHQIGAVAKALNFNLYFKLISYVISTLKFVKLVQGTFTDEEAENTVEVTDVGTEIPKFDLTLQLEQWILKTCIKLAFRLLAFIGKLYLYKLAGNISASVEVRVIPVLRRLEIFPKEVQIEPEQSITFTARGFDQHGDEIQIGKVGWSATGGKIKSDGSFHAGHDEEDSFTVTARVGEFKGYAKVSLVELPPLSQQIESDQRHLFSPLSWNQRSYERTQLTPITPFYADTEFDHESSADSFALKNKSEDLESPVDDKVNAESEDTDAVNFSKNANRRTTDLVQIYLQEIGRIRPLRQDEEVSEAQKVQRYMQLLDLQAEFTVEGDEVMQRFVALINAHDRLASQLGHRPSLERWAAAAGMEVSDLKLNLATGKQRWADLAGLSVKELEQIEAQGKRGKEHMLLANLRLVVSIAKKYQNRGLELLDLIQEGTLGLNRAVEKFDPTKGYRFSTYAYWWIRQEIIRAIATQSRTIRLPVHITEKLNKIKKAQRKISQEKGRTATIEDIALELDMTPSQVREVLLRVPRSVPLDIKIGKEKDTELGDLLESEETSPEEVLMREALKRDLLQLLADLTSRERDVICMRFGLRYDAPYSFEEIGRALELSHERVRQIEAEALQKLWQPKRRNRVRDYLEALS
jgi:RNA polymerase nonessential primary-like sigma factor